MAVQFEFYKNPVQGEEEGETSYHPRVVNFQHVTTQRLAAEIHSATTFGKAEVEAMLMELSRCMGNHLREGQRVHLDGVGYFQITLQATEPIHSMAAHADKVKFKSVSFLADRDLKGELIGMHAQRSKYNQGKEKMGEEVGIILEEDIPQFLVKLGQAVESEELDFSQWNLKHPEGIKEIAKEYIK